MFDIIVRLIIHVGYWGVFVLMFGENVFPPIPSELIMPLAGFSAARGQMNLWLVIAAGTAGSVLGAFFWYWVGRWVGRDRVRELASRHGRWLTLCPEDFDKANAYFDRHRGPAVMLGRMVPGVRTLISVPAGVAGMAVVPFLFYSTIGSLFWTALLGGAGYLLKEQYTLVEKWVNPVANVVVGVLLIVYVYRVVTFGRRGKACETTSPAPG
jgi:membrane protein DedA with SNARE-associated domain